MIDGNGHPSDPPCIPKAAAHSGCQGWRSHRRLGAGVPLTAASTVAPSQQGGRRIPQRFHFERRNESEFAWRAAATQGRLNGRGGALYSRYKRISTLWGFLPEIVGGYRRGDGFDGGLGRFPRWSGRVSGLERLGDDGLRVRRSALGRTGARRSLRRPPGIGLLGVMARDRMSVTVLLAVPAIDAAAERGCVDGNADTAVARHRQCPVRRSGRWPAYRVPGVARALVPAGAMGERA